MKYIDLSHEIKNEMPVYPGDKEVNLGKGLYRKWI